MTGGHNGGDMALVNAFLADMQQGGNQVVSDVARSVESHLLVFAAEESRRTGQAIDMAAWTQGLRQK